MLLRAKGATCPSSQLVWVSRTFGFSWTNGVPRPVGFIHGRGWAVSMLAGGFTCSIIWQDHQVRGQSADGHQWKSCGLGLTNGRSRSELSAPWILRFDPQIRCVHQPSQVPPCIKSPCLTFIPPLTVEVQRPHSFNWGLDRSSLTTAGTQFPYV